MRILGIETSCDETAICLIEAEGDFGIGSPKSETKAAPNFKYKILGNALISQAALHTEYGGVFPNLAKREHAKNLVPLLEKCLHETNSPRQGLALPRLNIAELQTTLSREPELLKQLIPFLEQHGKPDIDALAVTHGPGLEPALWVGLNFAKALSKVWNVPIVGVNHMEGHIVMSMMEGGHLASFEFPVLALLISGGHTELVLSKRFGSYKLIGQTRDDAAGEAFDKVARMMQLPYPGGPHISALAKKAREENLTTDVKLPRPMLNENNLDFSFSGLKTAVLRVLESSAPISDTLKKKLAREFEDAVADVLVAKTLRAVETYGANTVLIGGGVSANTYIRAELKKRLDEVSSKLLVCPPELATDNALMIALAGYFHAQKREFADITTLKANGNLRLGDIS
ncbi:MAG: tRNA (adenosine(37)-N6)-threonylcarbamoyltransferase complex transferase subunit TsaD [bacterium]|nr:tRNA (adenosine(37)-N6)-threonylcarbamoyltransferase complex transferase subunit TsaD [bacterium]